MNSRKKIIKTLKKADKASVEKLIAEETKKNEIFARIQRRTNIEQTEYTDVVNGVEKYERRINMTRIASIAAAAVLMAGSVGGGAYLFRGGREVGPDGDNRFNSATTENTSVTDPSETTIVSGTGASTTKANVSSSTTTVSAAVVAVESTSAAVSVENGGNSGNSGANGSAGTTADVQASQWSISREELIGKYNNYQNYIDRFSADKTTTNQTYIRQYGRYCNAYTKGSMFLNTLNGTASYETTVFYDDEKISSDNSVISGDYWVSLHDCYDERFYGDASPVVHLKEYDARSLSESGSSATEWMGAQFENAHMPKLDEAGNNWEMTGENIENGRKVVYISGSFDSPDEYTILLDRYDYEAKIDAETGICLYVKFDYWDNMPDYTVELTNCRFGNDAIAPKTSSEIAAKVRNEDYYIPDFANYNIDSIGW